VRKKGKAQGVHSEMAFDPVGGFVEAKALRLNTRIAGVLHRL
jgi:hypothetical protein